MIRCRRSLLPILILLLSGLSLPLAAQSGDTLFDAGKTAYNQKLYSLAAQTFQEFLNLVSHQDPRADDASYMMALSFLHSRDYAQAESLFTSFSVRYPDSVYLRRIPYWHGIALYGTGRYEESLSHFLEQENHPDDRTYYLRALLYAGNSARRCGKADLAEELFRKLIAETSAGTGSGESGMAAAAFYHLGNLLQEEGRFREAQEELTTLVSRYPASTYAQKALFFLGETFFERENFPEAAARYKRLLSLYPDSEFVPQAAYRLVDIARRKGDAEQAAEGLEILREKAPGELFPQAAEMVAGFYLEEGRFEEASEIWEQLLADKPEALDYASLLYHNGLTHELAGNPAEALTWFEKAQKEEAGTPLLERNLLKHIVSASLSADQRTAALTAFSQLLALYPQTPEKEESARALILSFSASPPGSAELSPYRDFLTELIRTETTPQLSAEWSFAEGSFLMDREQYTEALSSWHAAGAYYPEAFYFTGTIYTLRREYRRAERVYQQLLEKLDSPGPLLFEAAGRSAVDPDELRRRGMLALGICALNLEEYESARRRFDNLARMDSRTGKSWQGEALYYRAICEQKTGRLLASTESFREAARFLENQELLWESLYQTGWSFLQMDRYEPARRSLEQLTEEANSADGETPLIYAGRARLLIGRSYMREGRWDDALEAFRSLGLAPYPEKLKQEARLRIVQTLLRAGRDGKLQEAAQTEGLESRSGWQQAREEGSGRTADEALEAGQYERAAALYALHGGYAAEAGRMPDGEMRVKQGYALQMAGDSGRSAEVLLEMIAADPQAQSVSSAAWQLADLIRRSSSVSVAEPWIDRLHQTGALPAVTLMPDLELARLLSDAEPEKALDIVRSYDDVSLSGEQRRSLLLFEAGHSLRHGETDKAERIYETLRNSSSARAAAEARLGMGKLLAGRGEENAAAAEWMSIALLYPSETDSAAEGLYRAWQSYRKLGKTGEAEAARQKLKAEYPDTRWASLGDS